MDKSRVGERGVSVLGALVFALMLGTGAVVTYELAAPPLASVSPDSQTASSAAAEKAAKEKKEREEKIKKMCDKAKKSLEKAPVGTVTKHGSKIFEDNVDPVEPSNCVGAIKVSDTETKCVGLKSKITLLSGGDVRVDSNPDISLDSPGICLSKYCSKELTDKKASDKCKEVATDGYKPIKQQGREPGVFNAMGPNAKENLMMGPISKAEGKVLAENLRPAQREAEDAYEAAVAERRGAEATYDAIKCVGDDADCKDRKEEAKKELTAAREAEIEAEKRYDNLSDKIERLQSGKGPQEKDSDPCPPGATCTAEQRKQQKQIDATRAAAEAAAQQRGQQTFGDPSGQGNKGGGGDLSQLLKGLAGTNQPPPGNGVPQPAGTCSPSMICGNNTIYSRNNQCVDQAMQQCQYGCNGTQCSQPPQQGSGCLTAPSQPDPSGCQNGTYKPTYGGQNNACVVGWQCVPGTGGGSAPTAQLSCQPKVADVGMEVLITFSCSAGTSSGNGFNTNGAQSGSATSTLSAPPGDTNTANFGLTCSNAGLTGSAQCSVQVGKPGIVLVANPKSVESGKTSALGWVTSGMQKCIISSPNLAEFTSQNADKTSVNGTATTPPLTATNSATTTYNFLLNCATLGGGTRQASTTVSATP